MKTSPNIGIINALIRITCGLTVVAFFTAKLSRKPWCNSYLLMIFVGAMKVAEGIVRYCPVTELIQKGQGMMNQGNNQQNQESKNHNNTHNQRNENQNNTQNPPSIPPELADSIKNVLE
ncbi:MAG: YgaP family membrane protein [Heyndrickxia sp.]